MIIGIPKEIKANESRVSILPFGVEELVKSGHKVLIENNAGIGSGFSNEVYKGLDSTRIEIFSRGINLLQINPFFGIGATSFTEIYRFETGFWKGHSHNLLLELAISYGLPTTFIFFTTINTILLRSGKFIFNNKRLNDLSLYDRAFWTALFFFIISQLADIQYFDGKISLIVWILIAALKNIIEENNNKALS